MPSLLLWLQTLEHDKHITAIVYVALLYIIHSPFLMYCIQITTTILLPRPLPTVVQEVHLLEVWATGSCSSFALSNLTAGWKVTRLSLQVGYCLFTAVCL
jgi:hypothetical protein